MDDGSNLFQPAPFILAPHLHYSVERIFSCHIVTLTPKAGLLESLCNESPVMTVVKDTGFHPFVIPAGRGVG